MSMIREQVKMLRRLSDSQETNIKVCEITFKELQEELLQAADTIEALSAKLSAANMEQSDRYYNSEWIPCESGKLPDHEVICCDQCGEMIFGYISEDESCRTGFTAENDNECMYNCIKWMEKPKP